MSTAMEERPLSEHVDPENPRLMHRFRLVAVSIVLAALAFIQDPGRIAADTKLDLSVDADGFLARALTLWEPTGFFGQLQNQAYGYLFPVGPFFVLGDLVGLPAWVVQRLWWALVLIAAFLGVVRLARLLGVKGESARILAGLAYALAPRMVTELGVLTVEVLPFAVAPWVLIPLVMAVQGRYTARRGAALSGIAVLFAGGVNAVATSAVLPLGLLWILTRGRGRERWQLLGWWTLAVGLATLWWAVPLLLLGRYSPPFLDWIESSSITTLFTSPDAVVRGASQWVAYVVEPGGPTWPGGWALVSTPVLVLATGLLAAVGLAGLAARGTPYRTFLVGGVLLGTVLVSLGHTGVVQGLGAPALQDLLDGPLAPLRNTHKFDLVLRLPLALGVGFAIDAAVRRVAARRSDRAGAGGLAIKRHGPQIVAGAMVILLTVSAWPMVTGTLVRDRSFESIPAYWSDVADWLAEESPDGRALLVPGASFGIYSWGRTQDEPLQPLATSPWAVRDAVPLSSAGNIRWLDAVQERIDSGRGSPRLADALARAGVTYVVLRNDIDQRRSAAPRPVLVRQALLRSGGFTPVAGFGPALPPFRTATTVVDDGLQDTVAAVEIWRVESPLASPDPRVVVRNASEVTVVAGSAESVIDLADSDLLGTDVAVIAGDEEPLLGVAGVDLGYAVTDGFRRSEVSVGSSRDNRSETLRVDDPFQQNRRVHDYLPVPPEGRQSIAVYDGGIVTASSSGSEVTSLRARSSAYQPWSAVDGDPATAWVSGQLNRGVGQWWEVATDRAFRAPWVSVRLVVGELAGVEPTEITVTTDAGEVTTAVSPTDQPQRLPVPPGPTTTLRLTLAAVAGGGPGEAFGLREVVIPGVEISRAVAAPGLASGGPIVLSARKGEQSGCAAVSGQLVCTPQLGRPGEERTGIRRTIEVGAEGEYRVQMWVRPRVGSALDRLLAPALDISPRASASSVFTSDPANRAQAAVDGVLSTSWLASPLDSRPVLTLTWGEERRIRGVRLDVTPDLVASRPLRVTATVNGRETTDIVSGRGTIRVPAQEAKSITLRFDNAEIVRSVDPATGSYTPLPVGVNEVRILGAEDIVKGPRLADRVSVPCGFGPVVAVNGTSQVRTQVSSTVTEALTDSLIKAVPCDGRVLTLSAGRQVIEAASTAEFAVEMLALEPVVTDRSRPMSGAAADSDVDIRVWTPTAREVSINIGTAPRILETTENFNAGWTASIDGATLTPVRVDGWRQGWVVPAGDGGVVAMAFAPQKAYQVGLLVGLAAVAGLVALAWMGRHRRGTPHLETTPTRSSRESQVILALAGLACATLLGGLPGLAVAAAAITLTALISRPVVVVALAAGTSVGAAAAPWPGRLDSPDWLLGATALLAIGALSAVSGPAGQNRAWRDEPTPGAASPG